MKKNLLIIVSALLVNEATLAQMCVNVFQKQTSFLQQIENSFHEIGSVRGDDIKKQYDDLQINPVDLEAERRNLKHEIEEFSRAQKIHPTEVEEVIRQMISDGFILGRIHQGLVKSSTRYNLFRKLKIDGEQIQLEHYDRPLIPGPQRESFRVYAQIAKKKDHESTKHRMALVEDWLAAIEDAADQIQEQSDPALKVAVWQQSSLGSQVYRHMYTHKPISSDQSLIESDSKKIAELSQRLKNQDFRNLIRKIYLATFADAIHMTQKDGGDLAWRRRALDIFTCTGVAGACIFAGTDLGLAMKIHATVLSSSVSMLMIGRWNTGPVIALGNVWDRLKYQVAAWKRDRKIVRKMLPEFNEEYQKSLDAKIAQVQEQLSNRQKDIRETQIDFENIKKEIELQPEAPGWGKSIGEAVRKTSLRLPDLERQNSLLESEIDVLAQALESKDFSSDKKASIESVLGHLQAQYRSFSLDLVHFETQFLMLAHAFDQAQGKIDQSIIRHSDELTRKIVSDQQSTLLAQKSLLLVAAQRLKQIILKKSLADQLLNEVELSLSATKTQEIFKPDFEGRGQ